MPAHPTLGRWNHPAELEARRWGSRHEHIHKIYPNGVRYRAKTLQKLRPLILASHTGEPLSVSRVGRPWALHEEVTPVRTTPLARRVAATLLALTATLFVAVPASAAAPPAKQMGSCSWC